MVSQLTVYTHRGSGRHSGSWWLHLPEMTAFPNAGGTELLQERQSTGVCSPQTNIIFNGYSSYMYAVSIAIERARESIWILDWWLSPELYLRRPPAKNQQYRLDRMLHAAAERGVKIKIIVYKEVTQALTRKLLNPTLPDYLHSLLPHTTDKVTKAITRVGLDVIFKSLEEWEKTDPLIQPPISVSSAHTKHELEGLHGMFTCPALQAILLTLCSMWKPLTSSFSPCATSCP